MLALLPTSRHIQLLQTCISCYWMTQMILGSLYLLAKLHSHRSQTSLPMIGIWITTPLYGAMCPSHFGVANHCIMHPIHARALEKRHNAPHASKSSTSRNPCNNIFCLLDILLHLKKWPQYSHE